MPSGGVPPHHWKTTTFVAGLRSRGIAAPFVLDGPINRIAFETYVDKVLVPELEPGDIVIMDNLSNQKKRAAEMRSTAARAPRLLFPSPPTAQPPIKARSSRLICARPQSAPSMASGTRSDV